MRVHIGRWHIEYQRRVIHITHTPNPNCRDCGGTGGGWEPHWSGADWAGCYCLYELRSWRLPIWPRRTNHQYSEEPF